MPERDGFDADPSRSAPPAPGAAGADGRGLTTPARGGERRDPYARSARDREPDRERGARGSGVDRVNELNEFIILFSKFPDSNARTNIQLGRLSCLYHEMQTVRKILQDIRKFAENLDRCCHFLILSILQHPLKKIEKIES